MKTTANIWCIAASLTMAATLALPQATAGKGGHGRSHGGSRGHSRSHGSRHRSHSSHSGHSARSVMKSSSHAQGSHSAKHRGSHTLKHGSAAHQAKHWLHQSLHGHQGHQGHGNGHSHGHGHHGQHWYHPSVWRGPVYGGVVIGGCQPVVVTEVVETVVEVPAPAPPVPDQPAQQGNAARLQLISGEPYKLDVTGLPPEQGDIVLEINQLGLRVDVTQWTAREVRFVVPTVALPQATSAKLHLIDAEGRLRSSIDVDILPPRAPQGPAPQPAPQPAP